MKLLKRCWEHYDTLCVLDMLKLGKSTQAGANKNEAGTRI